MFTEAERLLARTSGGLSLLERLARDPVLRQDLRGLIDELIKEPDGPELQPLAAIARPGPGGARKRTKNETSKDDEMESDLHVRDSTHVTMAQQPG